MTHAPWNNIDLPDQCWGCKTKVREDGTIPLYYRGPPEHDQCAACPKVKAFWEHQERVTD